MSAIVPDSAIELTGFSVHRSDSAKELTGKSRGGGVCFYINNSWCNERNIHSFKSLGSPDLEFHTLLCRPFWLTREFTAIIITAVYIPPQANTDQALRELYRNISEQETAHPDAAFIITRDFNKANFRTIAPKYFQHVTINTRGDRTLDHCYTPFRDAYKSLPRQPFGKSDHSSVLQMLCSHRCSAEEGTSASLLPETAEEVWNEPQNPQVLLHLHCGEHPDRLYHRLVWKQHRWQPQGSAKGRANCPPHCWRWASLPPEHLHQAVYKESPEDYQRLQPPVPQTALSVALRATFPQHPIPH